ncbi:tyrosine-type recombinase/integrase [Alphaproteobacteria bacterium]|nr:tyrosine-type recombinase/integrase [Alphaproteobacteria bacterium]
MHLFSTRYWLRFVKIICRFQHINDAYAPNTIRAYRADFSEWINFCTKKGACPLPADPFIVSEFLLSLADAGNNRASTIRRKCASISAIHRYGYFEDPTKHPEVKIAIRKINRRLGTRFRQARPINRHLLDRMLHVCGDDLRGTRNRMILLLAYTTLRRRSELTSLRVADLTQCGDGQSLILLCQSKTDQTREGVLLALDIETTYAVKHWIELAGVSDGFLLRGITGKQLNQSMDPGQISRMFKSLAVKAKLDPKQISGHSTRIGAAQDMLSGGASIGQIMAKVGWSKVDTVMRYVGVGELSALQSKSNYR